jgi:hypothetical protein
MRCTACSSLAVAGYALLTIASATMGQQPEPPAPPAPVPVVADTPPPAPTPAPVSPRPIVTPSPYVTPAVPYFSDRDPLLDRPNAPAPGLFGNVELDIVGVHVKNRLTDTVTIDGVANDTVHLPGAQLGWTASPRFELGYRLPDGCGEFTLGYRFLTAEGTNPLVGDQIAGQVKSRLILNEVDFDYASREFSLAPNWDMKWKLGARLAGVYYDACAYEQTVPDMFAALQIQQRTSNNFWGAGPHAGLQLTRQLDIPGLSLYGQVEGATLLGQIHQRFSESFTFNDVPNMAIQGSTALRHTQAVPMVNVQLGLRWSPPGWNRAQFFFGYQYEYWWSLGQVDSSNLELSDQGVFFRGEFNF